MDQERNAGKPAGSKRLLGALLLLTVLAAAGGTGCVSARSPRPASETVTLPPREAIQATYDAENAVFDRFFVGKAPASALFPHHAPDFVALDRKGRVTTLAQERQGLEMFEEKPLGESKHQTHIRQFVLQNTQGTQATVVAERHGNQLFTDPQNPAHRSTLEGWVVTRDFWVKGSEGWQIKREATLSVKGLFNGKPMGRRERP